MPTPVTRQQAWLLFAFERCGVLGYRWPRAQIWERKWPTAAQWEHDGETLSGAKLKTLVRTLCRSLTIRAAFLAEASNDLAGALDDAFVRTNLSAGLAGGALFGLDRDHFPGAYGEAARETLQWIYAWSLAHGTSRSVVRPLLLFARTYCRFGFGDDVRSAAELRRVIGAGSPAYPALPASFVLEDTGAWREEIGIEWPGARAALSVPAKLTLEGATVRASFGPVVTIACESRSAATILQSCLGAAVSCRVTSPPASLRKRRA